MTEALITGVVELAKLAVIAYGIPHVRAVAIHWLDTASRKPLEERQIDAERKAGIGGYAEQGGRR